MCSFGIYLHDFWMTIKSQPNYLISEYKNKTFSIYILDGLDGMRDGSVGMDGI